jgi:antitoxin MazE
MDDQALEGVQAILNKWQRQDYVSHVRSSVSGNPTIEVPVAIRREMLIEIGAEVEWQQAEDGRLTITIAPPMKYNLADLVDGITPENRHEYIDTGNPVGK